MMKTTENLGLGEVFPENYKEKSLAESSNCYQPQGKDRARFRKISEGRGKAKPEMGEVVLKKRRTENPGKETTTRGKQNHRDKVCNDEPDDYLGGWSTNIEGVSGRGGPMTRRVFSIPRNCSRTLFNQVTETRTEGHESWYFPKKGPGRRVWERYGKETGEPGKRTSKENSVDS